ncbi:E1-E2 ATPase-domain-containing protein [Dipodascopsis tothii]|uniref:E1-E2 ATPase-domain-containing protein n=1 Tax=Dipodascopsis tothii TaxID=44089 RepID=UPI0034CEC506
MRLPGAAVRGQGATRLHRRGQGGRGGVGGLGGRAGPGRRRGRAPASRWDRAGAGNARRGAGHTGGRRVDVYRPRAPSIAPAATTSEVSTKEPASAPQQTSPNAPQSDMEPLVENVFTVNNIHCKSCVNAVSSIVYSLSPKPVAVNTSLETKSVAVTHSVELTKYAIAAALKEGGFEVSSSSASDHGAGNSLLARWRRQRMHRKFCKTCNEEQSPLLSSLRHTLTNTTAPSAAAGDDKLLGGPLAEETDAHSTYDLVDVAVVSDDAPVDEYRAVFSVGGMTCAACTNAITAQVKMVEGVIDVNVDLLGHSATVVMQSEGLVDEVKETIEDVGYDCDLVEVLPTQPERSWKVTATIGGMTCASCVNSLTDAFKPVAFVKQATITLLTNSGTFIVDDPVRAPEIRDVIEDAGFDCGPIEIVEERSTTIKTQSRTVTVAVNGMYCEECPREINASLEAYGKALEVHSGPVTLSNSVIRMSYIPNPPSLTLRSIVDDLQSISPRFKFTIVHPPTLEERAQAIALRERKHLMYRMILSLIVSLPTFVIGIVYMSLASDHDPGKMYVMEPLWVGRVSRGTWAMFFMSTVVYFFAADIFHKKAFKEVRSLWKKGVPWTRRLFRFGSMNLLMSLGTTISYFASIALLILEAQDEGSVGYTTTYFDSVVFLTMFLLVGRLLEAYSKSKTASAISLLTNLRPKSALLLDVRTNQTEEIMIDYLEKNDIVRLLPGMSPPADAIIISGSTEFNESALTGESKPVEKTIGDQVYSGTSNTGGGVVDIRISASEGGSMLDQITDVVRQGQSKRAPIERVADILTGFFVPIVTLIAVSTWIIWLVLGESGALPDDYYDIDIGGWVVWALEFAISVFVVACPCGLGLAAPTAMFVGTGLAAKHGILPRGGGEAFQEGAQVDVVVFDKTGTLTEGGEPQITSTKFLSVEDRSISIQLARDLELNSTHPIGKAIIGYAEMENDKFEASANETGTAGTGVQLAGFTLKDIKETAGYGLKGYVAYTSAEEEADPHRVTECIIGNEKWMTQNGAVVTADETNAMLSWKQRGESVILLGLLRADEEVFRVTALFGASDKIREESPFVIAELQKRGIQTWMISGDNEITAKAVARVVGIPESQVIAGVLPQEKAEKVTWLQQTAGQRKPSYFSGRGKKERAIVAMVGDGINDAPPLTAADVGIAIGSGSDIALSSAKFVLVNSQLVSILTLFDISRKVFRRVKFNFMWAAIYNIIGIPIAAGVIYPIGHARLAPAWASLAMALSSVSVVCSSLLLKLYRAKNYTPKNYTA